MNNYNELDAARELYEDLVAGKVPMPLDRKEAIDIYKTIRERGDDPLLDSYLNDTITKIYNDKLESLNKNAFCGLTSLTTVDLPKVKTLGPSVFSGCTSLTHVELPAVQTIPTGTFWNCTSLKQLKLPSVLTITGIPFWGTSALTALILSNGVMCSSDNKNMFYKDSITSGTGYIYIPKALIENYKADSNWSKFASQFRVLEDYTVDGTITGNLDESKI